MTQTNPPVLVVDDDEFTAQLTAMMLDSAGYEVLIALSGAEALQVLADTPSVALVVSDMAMPGMDGITLLGQMRLQGCRMPFMLLTGTDADTILQAHPALDAVLTKDEQLQDVLPDLVASLLA